MVFWVIQGSGEHLIATENFQPFLNSWLMSSSPDPATTMFHRWWLIIFLLNHTFTCFSDIFVFIKPHPRNLHECYALFKSHTWCFWYFYSLQRFSSFTGALLWLWKSLSHVLAYVQDLFKHSFLLLIVRYGQQLTWSSVGVSQCFFFFYIRKGSTFLKSFIKIPLLFQVKKTIIKSVPLIISWILNPAQATVLHHHA